MGTARTDEAFTEQEGHFLCQEEVGDNCTQVHRARAVLNSSCCVCLGSSVILSKPEMKTTEVDSGTAERQLMQKE